MKAPRRCSEVQFFLWVTQSPGQRIVESRTPLPGIYFFFQMKAEQTCLAWESSSFLKVHARFCVHVCFSVRGP